MSRPQALVAACFLLGCGTSAPASNEGTEGGSDATVDAPQANGPDAALDVTTDTGADATGPNAPDATVDGGSDGGESGAPSDGATSSLCQLPGSVQFTAGGTVTVPGGSPAWPSVSFLTLPTGFCAHYFGTVANARQLRFAPGGELFVASPSQTTAGGGPGGQAAIVVLPDDNLDGVADAPTTFLGTLPSTQGLLFANSYLYYQDGTKIMRLPYATGQRAATGTPEQVADITVYTSTLHWPKTLDIADDGTIYVGNGGDQAENCDPSHPFHGGILSIGGGAGSGGGVQVAKGLRNPIAVRCARGHDHCFALELAKDYTPGSGREKLLPIHSGDDWGFPCCASAGLPYTSSPAGTDCSGVAAEANSFLIGDTPFGVDFEAGHWPGQWGGLAYVVTHGSSGSWTGVRIVGIPMDPVSGLPLGSSDTTGANVGMADFATGWDDTTLTHGRPAAVVFAADGRLFVANDNNGQIFWIAAL